MDVIKSILVALVLVGSLFVVPVSATDLSAGVSDDFENTGYFNNRITYLTFDGESFTSVTQGGEEQVVNGGAEDGVTGWWGTTVDTETYLTGTGSFTLISDGDAQLKNFGQTVDFTGVNTLYWCEKFSGVDGSFRFKVQVDTTILYDTMMTVNADTGWVQHSIDVSGFTGEQVLTFITYGNGQLVLNVDDISGYSGDLYEVSGIKTPTDSGVTVDGEHLYYFGTLASADSIEWEDGVACIDGISTSNFIGSMPMIPVGSSGSIVLDTDLVGVYEYSPKKCTVDYSSSDAGDVAVTVQLTDVYFNAVDQPEQTKIVLLDDTGTVFDEQVGTSPQFTILNVPDGEYDLQVSFYDYEFDGWSNVKLFTLSVFGNSVIVDDVDAGVVLGDADNIISGVQDAFADENDGIFKMATRGWLRFDLFNSILTGIANIFGFDLVAWSNGGGL